MSHITCENPWCPDCNPLPKELDKDLQDLAFKKETDAAIWADRFTRLVQHNPGIPTDVGTMITWFANAIMNGFDEGLEAGRKQYEPKIEVGRTDLHYLAGALSVPFMRDNPNYVMPSEEVLATIESFVEEHRV